MVEHGCKIEEKVKAMQSEIKEIYKEARVTGRKPGPKQRFGTKATIRNQRKK